MKASRGSLATLLRITVVLITLWGVDKILGGFRMAQMETMRRDIEATKLKTADERNAAIVLKAEGAELQERLAEARGDIVMLQKKMDAASAKAKEMAVERVHKVSICFCIATVSPLRAPAPAPLHTLLSPVSHFPTVTVRSILSNV